MDTIEVLVQNVQALPLMPQKHVEADVFESALDGDIILWQEINKLRYRKAVLSLGPEWGHLRVLGMGNIGGCPISWLKTRYKMVDKGKVKLTGGWPRICGTRYITWVLLRDLDSGAVILVHNFHYNAGAFSKKPQKQRKRRITMWNKSNRIHINFVMEWVREGYPVIGGGDLNRMFHPAVGERVNDQRVWYCTAAASIDELFFIPSEHVKFICTDVEVLPRYSDHAGRKATLAVRKVK